MGAAGSADRGAAACALIAARQLGHVGLYLGGGVDRRLRRVGRGLQEEDQAGAHDARARRGAAVHAERALLHCFEERRQLGRHLDSEPRPALVGELCANEQFAHALAQALGRAVPLTWSTIEAHVVQAGLRNQIEMLTDLLAEQSTGVLITLDEIHHNQIEELRELATVVQHTFRENRELAFAGAGLAASVSDVVNDDVLTFLRRAERHTLGSVARADVERALREPIQAAGRDVGEQALQIMVDGARGYPFLLQLVGAQVWRLNPSAPEITPEDATRGVARARRRLGALIHEPALSAASDIGKSFLLAMAQDDGPSRMADIQQRLGVDVNYASQYRLRLIAAELIYPTRRGYVDFALPYLREYLRQHSAIDA